MHSGKALSFAVFEVGSHEDVHHCARLGARVLQLAVTTAQNLRQQTKQNMLQILPQNVEHTNIITENQLRVM